MRSAVPHSPGDGLSAHSHRGLAGSTPGDTLRLDKSFGPAHGPQEGGPHAAPTLCDCGWGPHWPEEAEAAVLELWDRIRLDARHRLHWISPSPVVTTRHFPGSAMKLAQTVADLARIDPWLVEETAPPACSAHPGLQADHAPDPDRHDRNCRRLQTRATGLAAVLTGPDPLMARRHLEGVLRDTALAEAAALVQAVLQTLDAGWMAGTTTDLQRQLALTLLQSALRLWLDVEEQAEAIGCALVSALPGTPDLCGVMLMVALLRRAGWSVRLLLPQTANQIDAAVQELQPDLIVLAGSRMAVRQGEMALLAGLLAAFASGCRAPVILGGKLAKTEPHALLHLGGTAVCSEMAWISTIAAPLAPHRPGGPAFPGDEPHAVQGADTALANLLAAGRGRPV